MMGLAVQYPYVFSLAKQPKLGFRRPTLTLRALLNLTEIADASSSPRFAPTVSNATSEGKRRDSGRTQKGVVDSRKLLNDERPRSKPSRHRKEEIISLFKRIQSKGGEPRGSFNEEEEKKINVTRSSEPVTETLLELLRQSSKKIEGDASAAREKKSRSTRLNANSKFARPPSDFKKRSPIPSTSGPREKLLVPKKGALKETAEEDEKTVILEKMKVAELKELAKAKDFKGYSKLKKPELLKLLCSSSSSTSTSSSYFSFTNQSSVPYQ